ncbi:TVP38/TMEM64 family protein [Peptoniphilus equinus]|uniref:TVP38/TMEM64 family membrane protein n=1 Tax=Peptoniphilus equinus TaxID=3016343 RepID=A0ABY7QVZ3_9FIRM|nr:TVP38/TMEM64 family protein [Peptoniphilus equinus]WBW50249.1 TVP38/TMEM64 family protein [Peptoniphilus equinus]
MSTEKQRHDQQPLKPTHDVDPLPDLSGDITDEAVQASGFNLNMVYHVLTVVTMGFFIYATYKGYKLGIFTSQQKLDVFIQTLGLWGPLFFVGVQIIQVVVPIIPGGVTSIAGVVIFGAVKGTIYNIIGCGIGSFINYFLARHYGRAFVGKLIGIKKLNRYEKWVKKEVHFDKAFAVAMVVPISPDDILCLFAGLLRMRLSWFTMCILLLKPWSILAYTLGGEWIVRRFLLGW